MTTITRSKTPGCRYDIHVQDEVRIKVALPKPFNLDTAGYEALEEKLHKAVEDVLAPFFKGVDGFIMCGDEVVAQITGPVVFTPPPPVTQGWGFPANSRKAHYFVAGIALCGRWAFGGYLTDNNHEHHENCTACMKKRSKLSVS